MAPIFTTTLLLLNDLDMMLQNTLDLSNEKEESCSKIKQYWGVYNERAVDKVS